MVITQCNAPQPPASPGPTVDDRMGNKQVIIIIIIIILIIIIIIIIIVIIIIIIIIVMFSRSLSPPPRAASLPLEEEKPTIRGRFEILNSTF